MGAVFEQSSKILPGKINYEICVPMVQHDLRDSKLALMLMYSDKNSAPVLVPFYSSFIGVIVESITCFILKMIY